MRTAWLQCAACRLRPGDAGKFFNDDGSEHPW
jgi:hypothetical protein